MIERQGNMFEEYLSPEVIYVICTNGSVRNDGAAVMGRGTALAAANINPALPRLLGDLLLTFGNRPFILPGNFVTLPTKDDWRNPANGDLIEESLYKLFKLMDHYDEDRQRTIYLPRPGVGNGGLTWFEVEGMVEDCYIVKHWNTVVWRA